MLDEELHPNTTVDAPAPAVPARPWQRGGPSPNPTGRPRDPLRQLARDRSADALNVVLQIMESPDENAQTRLTAARLVLDRAWGTPIAMSATVDSEGQDVAPALNESSLLRLGEMVLAAEEKAAARERAGLLPAPTAATIAGYTPAEIDAARRVAFVIDLSKRRALAERQQGAISVPNDIETSDIPTEKADENP